MSLFFSCLLLVPSAWAEKSYFEKTGDILQVALPVSSLAFSYLKSEQEQQPWKKNLYPFLKSFSVAFAAVHVQKHALSKRRPNGDNTRSFPSGHTFSAFSGAAFNQSLYGYSLGIPSYLTAAFVGLSRIDAKQHFADDVLGGASIALLSNWYFTEKMNSSSQDVQPLILTHQDSTLVGLSGSTEQLLKDQTFKSPRVLFRYSFGPSDPNRVQLSQSSQSPMEFTDIPREFEHIYTSKAHIEYFFKSSNSAFVELRPFEWINRGNLPQNLNYDGVAWPTGQPVITDWRQYNLMLAYRYKPNLHRRWDISLGLGSLLSFAKLSIERQDETLRSEMSDINFYPMAELRSFYLISQQLRFGFILSGFPVQDQGFEDLTVSINYQLSPRWGTHLQYNSFRQRTKLASVDVENHQDTLWLGLSYSFF